MTARHSIPATCLLAVALNHALCFAQSSYEQGKAALDNHAYAEAEQYLAKAEFEAPGATNARALRAKALIHLDRYAEAEASLQDYLETHKDSPDGRYLLGYVELRLNKPKESLAVLTAAAKLQRPSPNDLKIVGLDYVLLKDYSDAVRWLEKSVAGDATDTESLYYLGRAYYVLNNFDKAVASFTHVLQIQPDHVKAQDNLGLCYDALNEPEQAETAFRKAIALTAETPKPSPQPYVNLADLLSRTAANPEALDLLHTAETLGGPEERIHELKARVYMESNELPQAETEVRAAIGLKPQSGPYHYLLGRILKKQGKVKEAEAEFALTKTLLGSHSTQVN